MKDKKIIEELAKKFGVPEEVMEERIKQEGLLDEKANS